MNHTEPHITTNDEKDLRHCHQHSHNLLHSGTGKLWILMSLSAGYMILEIIGGLASGSLALLADAGHMAVDVAAILLSLFAMWVAKRPPSLKRTYGYYRAEIFAALINGTMLFVVAIGIFIEAWHRFFSPMEIEGTLMAFISFGGLIVNVIGMVMVYRAGKENLNLKSVWLHLFTDALGSVASLIGAFFVIKFGWNLADPIISVLIGVFILYGGFNLLSECVNVLLEGVPRGIDPQAVRETLKSYGPVSDVHDLHIWTVTNGVIALSAHVILKENFDPKKALEEMIATLGEKFQIDHITLQLEPIDFVHTDISHLHA